MNRKYQMFLLGLLLLVVQPASALGEGGFSGRIDAGAGLMKTESHLEAGDDNKRIDSYTQDPESDSDIIPIVFFELSYGYGDGQRIYGGMPFDFENEPRPTLGWENDMGKAGELDLSIFYSLSDEVWEDPYLLGVARKETDMDAYGAKIAYGLGGWELSYELTQVDVDKDLAGERFTDLKRDGTIHDVELAYTFELGEGLSLEPSVGVTLADMDGRANRYKGGSAGIELTKHWDRFMFWGFAQVAVLDYDGTHPIFNKTRKDTVYETMAIFSWLDPFGYDRFSLSIGGGYENESSDIDFYDAKGFFSLIAISYEFGEGAGRGDDDD